MLEHWCDFAFVSFVFATHSYSASAVFVVGKLIKTCGSGWEEEVPAILRSDRSSLIDTAQDAQPMHLHSRVIQSGSNLDSFIDNSHTS